METFTLMTHQSFQSIAAAQELAERVAAIELFLEQLLIVLDGEGVMNTDALMHWISLARSRMLMTGSAAPRDVAALARLQRQVQS